MDWRVPLGEATDSELIESRKALEEVRRLMVGTLYPGIVGAQIADIQRELWRRDVKVEYAPGHTCRAGHP